ncbi:MAG: hypothetical protein AAFP19_03675 [Bacteroidota bacterium]
MNRVLLLLWLLSSICTIGAAQENKIESLKQQEHIESHIELLFFCRPSVELTLSPTDFQSDGIIETTTGELFKVPTAFQAKNNEIQVLINQKVYTLYPEKIQYALIGQRLFMTKEIIEEDNQHMTYFQLLSDGDLQLLMLYKADKPNQGILYVQEKKGSLQKIKPTKKNLYKLFGSFRPQIEDYVSQNRLDLRKVSDISKLFNYFHQLQQS